MKDDILPEQVVPTNPQPAKKKKSRRHKKKPKVVATFEWEANGEFPPEIDLDPWGDMLRYQRMLLSHVSGASTAERKRSLREYLLRIYETGYD